MDENTEILQSINEKMLHLQQDVELMARGNEGAEVPSVLDGQESILDLMNSILITQTHQVAEQPSTADYSEPLSHIATMQGYTNILLVVMLAILVLFSGIFAGTSLVSWFKDR